MKAALTVDMGRDKGKGSNNPVGGGSTKTFEETVGLAIRVESDAKMSARGVLGSRMTYGNEYWDGQLTKKIRSFLKAKGKGASGGAIWNTVFQDHCVNMVDTHSHERQGCSFLQISHMQAKKGLGGRRQSNRRKGTDNKTHYESLG